MSLRERQDITCEDTHDSTLLYSLIVFDIIMIIMVSLKERQYIICEDTYDSTLPYSICKILNNSIKK